MTLLQDPKVYSRSPFVMYGRGYQTILSGFNRVTPQMWIDIRSWRDGQNAWSARAVMQPPDAEGATVLPPPFGEEEEIVLDDGSLYAYWLSGAGTFQTGIVFAAGAPEDRIPDVDAGGTLLDFSGSVYMYRGEFSQWTNTQKLLPDQVVTGSFFGDSISICPKIPTNMAIGAHGDYSSGLYQSGAAYFFGGSPTGRYWSQKQKLVPSDRAEEDWFGYRVVLYDEFLFISSQYDDDHGDNAGALYVFRQERAHGLNIWSQQQKMYSSGVSLAYGEFVTAYAHTMVIGSNFEDEQGGQTKTGAVYVYKTYKTPEMPFVMGPGYYDNELTVRDGDKPKPKPVPMFKWWSEQQKLLARDWHVYRYFGTYTTVYGDGKLIATGAFGEAFEDSQWEFPPTEPQQPNYRSGSAYIFVKDDKYDRWTQQQKFISPSPRKGEYFSDPYLHGTDLIIRNTKVGYVYSDNMNWNCLIISVSDHFGDGWDKAYLMAYAPGANTKLTDHYTPFCDSANPLVMRYCPLLMEDEGLYFFKMMDGYKKHKYWGEIQFEIKNEATSEIYYGNSETSIGFEWDMETLSFTHVLSKHDKLVNDDFLKCEACPKPPPKPKAAPKSAEEESHGRSLKGKSKTSSPTISPAPTMAVGNFLDYSAVKSMTTSLNGWHGYGLKNNTGAFWEIYNGNHNSRGTQYSKHGTQLLYRGTICGLGVPMSYCDLELPDGDYVFRVGGALDADKGDHTWEFCGKTGGMQEMLTFSIVNRQCIAYSSYTAASYCSDVVGVIVVEGVIQLTGLQALELSEYDLQAVGIAVKHLMSPTSVKEVEASHDLESSELGYLVKFRAYVDMQSLGLEDGDDSLDVFDILAAQLQAASDSGHLTEEVAASSEELTVGAHGLMNVRNAKLLSFTSGGEMLYDNTKPQMNAMVTDMMTESSSSGSEADDASVVEKVVSVESELGYVMIGLVGLVVVGVGWRVAIRKDIHSRVPVEPYGGGVADSEVTASTSLLSSVGAEPDREAATSRMDRLRHMGPGLKQMADIEDAALKQLQEDMDM